MAKGYIEGMTCVDVGHQEFVSDLKWVELKLVVRHIERHHSAKKAIKIITVIMSQ